MLTRDYLIPGLMGQCKECDYCFGTLRRQQSPSCSICQIADHHSSLADVTGQNVSSYSFKSHYVSFWKTDHLSSGGRHFFNCEKSSCHHQDTQTISRFLKCPGQKAKFQCNSQLPHPLPTNPSSGPLSKSQMDRFPFLFLLPSLWQDLGEQLTSCKRRREKA